MKAEIDAAGFASRIAANSESYAQLKQDQWVLFMMADMRDGYFVEFGAGDGVTDSNTYLLERKYGWRGVLAEPQVEMMSLLRSRRPASMCFDVAVGPWDGKSVFNETSIPGLSYVSGYGVDELTPARVVRRSHAVRVLSLNSLLDEAEAPAVIDYLSIDVEGAEYDVLRTFDFTKRRVRLMTVEHNGTSNRRMIRELLDAHGFRWVDWPRVTQWDDWFIGENA